jgi:ABC-2 type transport system permease protein
MKNAHPLWQLFLSRLREFYREPEAVFWVYGFPVLLAVGLGIAFMNKQPDPTVIDVQDAGSAADAAALLEHLHSQGVTVERHDAESARQRLKTGKTTLVVVPGPDGFDYVYDPTRPESMAARHQVDSVIQRWKAGAAAAPAREVLLTEPGSRYIDFLVPGLMGMNIMGGGLWGVGFVTVDMRVRKLLKRLLATPMRREHFLLALLTARLIFLLPEMGLLLAVGYFAFGVPLVGNFLTLLLTIFVGASAFSGIGLFVACRADKTETVSGLMNLVMLPMWLLSGTFFSSKRFPDVAQPFIQALPLTQLNDALREVMLEGASVWGIGWRLGILAAYGVVTFLLALKWFKWQ